MKINKAYKTELDPNNVQRTLLLKHAGAARWAYNWGLKRKIDSYKTTGKSPSALDLHKELVLLKQKSKGDGGIPWMYEISKCAPQEALRDLDKAYAGFFLRCKKGTTKKGFPKFKSRKSGIGGFRLVGAIHPRERSIQLPRLGELRLKEKGYFPLGNIKILSASVTERAGHWFVSLNVKEEIPEITLTGEIIGIDVGINHLATLSDGTVTENPRSFHKAESRLRLLQKSVSRKKKGSQNRRKAIDRVAKQHYRISNIRKDAIQKATSAVITKQPIAIGIETLNVKGMLKNHKISKALSDASLAEYHRCLEYKAKWAAIPILKAGKFYPSSKTCNVCDYVKEKLSLGEREFRCENCGAVEDRDLNAALNLKKLAVSSTVTACCPGSSGWVYPTKLLVEQESSTNISLLG